MNIHVIRSRRSLTKNRAKMDVACHCLSSCIFYGYWWNLTGMFVSLVPPTSLKICVMTSRSRWYTKYREKGTLLVIILTVTFLTEFYETLQYWTCLGLWISVRLAKGQGQCNSKQIIPDFACHHSRNHIFIGLQHITNNFEHCVIGQRSRST